MTNEPADREKAAEGATTGEDREPGRQYGEDESPFKPRSRAPQVQRTLPDTGALRHYQRPTARKDVITAVTVAALAIPSAMAGAPSETRFVVFDAESQVGIDASGVEAVGQIVKALERSDITFVVANLKGFVQEQFEPTKLTDRIGADISTVSAAIEWCVAVGPKSTS